MVEAPVEHRLPAVLTADVAEYSRRCRRSAYGRGQWRGKGPYRGQ